MLALHLKRFKYIEAARCYKKLMHRVVFPNELRLGNTTDEAPGAEGRYRLFAVVVHVGSGPNHGHYVCLVHRRGSACGAQRGFFVRSGGGSVLTINPPR